MYTQRVQINLAASLAGHEADLSAQLTNPSTGAPILAPITTGFATNGGNGGYIWTYSSFADNTSYGVTFSVSGIEKASTLVEPPTESEGGGSGTFTYTVTVTSNGTTPISGASVRVVGSATNDQAMTNGSGVATFHLDTDNYAVYATRAGYQMYVHPTAISVSADGNTTITMTVTPTLSSGTLDYFTQQITTYDAHGQPKEGVGVYMRCIKAPEGSSALSIENIEDVEESDDNGNVSFTLIEGATYDVWAGNGRRQSFIADSTSSTGSVPAIIES